MNKPRLLILDRDGTLIREPADYQVDSFEKFSYYPGVMAWLPRIVKELNYELIMVTNQDGLGTEAYPESSFYPIQNFLLRTLEEEGVSFKDILIDRSFPEENSPNRKPNTGLLQPYLQGNYDLHNSFVVGDRLTDMELALNLGAQGIWLIDQPELGSRETQAKETAIRNVIQLETQHWAEIYQYLRKQERRAKVRRTTKETDVFIDLSLDGTGRYDIQTGIGFFDHMLEQLSRHGGLDLEVKVKGDLHIDEHHTVEDTALALGEAFRKALGDKLGLERYGFYLPMDDADALVGIDFGGRSWLVWEAEFKREAIGGLPTELFDHFFKSFCDTARCNLNIKVNGKNEHHKIEAIFKAVARSIKKAVQVDFDNPQLPTTKGTL
jgi:imidazoleglycerol-phosphate dehydratase/histidinol-phosphatase